MRKKNGFTLIELLATLLIICLITTIAVITIKDNIENTKDKAQKLTQNALFQASSAYVAEYKTNSTDWYTEYIKEDTSYKETGNEYACTTIQMLIDKGYLKNNIIDAKTNESINHNTQIQVIRNKTTKVIFKKVIMSSQVCKELDSVIPSVMFTPDGSNLVYKPTVTITAITGESNVKSMTYYIKKDNNKYQEVTTTSDLGEITIEEIDGENIKVCANVTNGIDVSSGEVCSNYFNVDNTPPKIDKIENINGSNNINITVIEKNIDSYCITKENNTNNCTWVNITSNIFNINVEEEGDYYIYIKDKVNLISNDENNKVSISIDKDIPSVIFTPNGTDIWSKSVDVKLTKITGTSGIKNTNYYIKKDNIKYRENTTTTTEDEIITVDVEGSNIYVCAVVENKIGITSGEICSNIYKIDNTPPKVELSSLNFSGEIQINVIEDNIDSYCVIKDNDINNCTWIETSENNFNTTVTEEGIYNVYVKDKATNIGTSSIDIILEKTVTVDCSVSNTNGVCTISENIDDIGEISSITTTNGVISYSLNEKTITLTFKQGAYTQGTALECNCTTTVTEECTCGQRCCTPQGGGSGGSSYCESGGGGSSCLVCYDVSCVAGLCDYNECKDKKTTTCNTCYTYQYQATIKYKPE